MPFDASIILGSKPIDTNQNALQQFLQLQQFKTLQQSNALAQQAQNLQIQQAQQEIADDQAGRNLPPGATQDQILAKLGPIRGAALLKSLTESHAADMKLNNDRAEWQGKVNNLRGHAVVGLETNLTPETVFSTVQSLRNGYDNEGADAISRAYYAHGLDGVGQLIQKYKAQSPEVTDETLKRDAERRERENLQRMKHRDEMLGLHEQNEESQQFDNAAALEAQRKAENAQKERQLNIEQGGLSLRQKEFNQQYGDPLAGLTDGQMRVITATANGDAAPPKPGSKGYQGFVSAVLAKDDTWTPQRYETKKSYKTGQDARELELFGTVVHHANRYIKNSQAMGRIESLTSAAGITGNQKALKSDANLLSGDVGKLVTGGVVGVEELSKIGDNLKSPIDSVRLQAVNELKDLAAGKYNSKINKYEVGTQQPFDPKFVPDPEVRKSLKDAGVDIYRGKGQPQDQGQGKPKAGSSDVPAVGSTFNGGKVKSVTRIQ
jgi:hypothetical protein